jgi:predicted TIM-barrel fold metal-dependent hydrolase
MITDFLTRLWPDGDPFAGSAPRGKPAITSPDHGDLESHSAAVVLGYRADRLGIAVPNPAVAERIATDPGFYAGFGAIDPLADSLEHDLATVIELGLTGLTIAPADQGCRPTHERCRYVLEWAAARGMPVLVSNPGLTDPRSIMEFARPSLFDEVCRDLPALRLVLGDLGRAWLDEALLMCARHERVFAEISTIIARPAALESALSDAHERGVTHKLFFASGSPAMTTRSAVQAVYALIGFGRHGEPRNAVPREVLRSIVERDSLAAVGIERPARARALPIEDPETAEAASWN